MPAWKTALQAYGKRPRNHEELLRYPFVQLYDLDKDPAERKNLAQEKPDLVEELAQELKGQILNGRSTPGPKLKNGRDRIHPVQNVPAFVWKKETTKKP